MFHLFISLFTVLCILSLSQALLQNDSIPQFNDRAIGPGGSGGRASPGGRGGRGTRLGHNVEYPELPPKPISRFRPTESDAEEYDLGRAVEGQDDLHYSKSTPLTPRRHDQEAY